MNIDSFLEIGSSHKVCEDYIIHGNEPFPYIILSDGCSSSDNTEMGARILCHLAKQYLSYKKNQLLPFNSDNMGSWIIHNAELVARQLGLKLPALDATLIVAYYNQDSECIHTHFFGDGSLIYFNNEINGVINTTFEYSNNAPYYLSYLVDEERNEQYHDLKCDQIWNVTTDNQKPYSMTQAYDHRPIITVPKKSSDFVMITSDGIDSFLHENPSERDDISTRSIIGDMTNFKNKNGEFLKRRLKKQMKQYRDQNINHYDDLSVGVFLF